MTDHGFTFFDTAIGRCGIAWNGRGIVAAQLPGTDEARMRARLLRRCPQAREGAPPPAVEQVIDRIVALLAGEAADLSDVALDMEGVPPFNRRVYEIARTIPPGQTLTYGEIAARLDAPQGARAGEQGLGGEAVSPPV